MVYTLADGTQMTRRKRIPVTGAASGAQTDFQIKMAALAYAAAMQNDFDDLRFTQADMQTLIDAWMEDKSDGVSADVWAEFPTTPANGVTGDYWMYYGNAGAASDWDGVATFKKFDDMETSPGNWVEDGTYTGGSISSDGVHKTGSYSQKHTYDTGTTAFYLPLNNITVNDTIEFYKRSPDYSSKSLYIALNQGQVHDGAKQVSLIALYNDGNIKYYAGGWQTIMAYSVDTWYRFKLCNFNFTAHTFDIYIDDMNTPKVTGAAFRNSLAYFDNLEHEMSEAGAIGYTDMVFVRKYAANPPTAAIGTEEHQRGTPQFM